MSEAKKPEWFEIVESDEPIRRKNHRRSSSIRTVAAFAVTGAIISGGALIANVEDESPAIAQTVVETSALAPATGQDNAPTTLGNEAVNMPVAITPVATRDAIPNPMAQGARHGDDDDDEFDDHHERKRHGEGDSRDHDDDDDDDDHEDFDRDSD